MRCFMLENSECSDRKSSDYIRINNCGWFTDCTCGMKTLRPDGRQDYQLIYIKKGCIEFEDVILYPGGIYLFKTGYRQIYTVKSDNTEYYWVHFTGKICDEYLGDLSKHYVNNSDLTDFERFCKNIVRNSHKNENNYLKATGELIVIIAGVREAISCRKAELDEIDEITDFIRKHYYERISNEEYAKRCGLSKYYFIKKFSERLNITPQKFRQGIALEKSKSLLRDTNMKIFEIASSLGFEDSMYFSKVFKRYFGCSPYEYRTKNNNITRF